MTVSRRAFVLLCALTGTLASASAAAAGPAPFAGGPPFAVGGGPPSFLGGPPPGVGGGTPSFLTRDSVFGSAAFQQLGNPTDLQLNASSDSDGSNPEGTIVLTA